MLFQDYELYVKCKHPRPVFELVSPCPFTTTIIITPRSENSAIKEKMVYDLSVIRLFTDKYGPVG